MLKLSETFGPENIKWFVFWNLLFTVYSLLLKTSLLSLVSLAVALYVLVQLVTRLVQKRKEGE
jgi:hypothetical protein